MIETQKFQLIGGPLDGLEVAIDKSELRVPRAYHDLLVYATNPENEPSMEYDTYRRSSLLWFGRKREVYIWSQVNFGKVKA